MSPHLSAQTSPMRIPVYKQRRMPILHGLGLSQRCRLKRDCSVLLNTCMGFFYSLTETSFISATWSPRSFLAYSRIFLRMEIALLTVFGASPVFAVPPVNSRSLEKSRCCRPLDSRRDRVYNNTMSNGVRFRRVVYSKKNDDIDH